MTKTQCILIAVVIAAFTINAEAVPSIDALTAEVNALDKPKPQAPSFAALSAEVDALDKPKSQPPTLSLEKSNVASSEVKTSVSKSHKGVAQLTADVDASDKSDSQAPSLDDVIADVDQLDKPKPQPPTLSLEKSNVASSEVKTSVSKSHKGVEQLTADVDASDKDSQAPSLDDVSADLDALDKPDETEFTESQMALSNMAEAVQQLAVQVPMHKMPDGTMMPGASHKQAMHQMPDGSWMSGASHKEAQ